MKAIEKTYVYRRHTYANCSIAVYNLYNAHGDVTALTDDVGEVTYNYEYDPYGVEIGEPGASESMNPYRYCGEYFDVETGFTYLRARYYDAKIGRFISEDPALDGLNWYAYCGNDPVNRCNPSGNSWEDVKNWFKKVGKGVKDGFLMFYEDTVYSITHPKETIKGFFDPKRLALNVLDPVGVGRNFYTIGSSIRNNNPYALGKFAGGKAGEVSFVLVTNGVAKSVGKTKIAIKSKLIRRAVDPNKLKHIFGKAEHNLDGLLKSFKGNRVKAYKAIEKAAQNYVSKKKINGIIGAKNQITVNVSGHKITVRGRVVNGKIKIGTVFKK